MTRRNVNPVCICIFLFSAMFLMGQDCAAQYHPYSCDPDPCVSPNAIAGTCMPLGGPCVPAVGIGFTCECEVGYVFYPWGAWYICVYLPETCEGVINFPDPNVDQAIREAIGKPSGDIYREDLIAGRTYPFGLTSLDAPADYISNLSGLECCAFLAQLFLDSNQIVDISPLSNLTGLWSLSVNHNQIVDISPLSNLTNLGDLFLSNNQIVDISPLATLRPRNISLSNNQIVNVSPLSNMTKLTTLPLDNNHIVDISPLSTLANLEYINLSDNQISDISPLAGLTSLEYLYLSDNQISDILPLVNNTGIGPGDGVYLNSNPLSTDSCTVHIPALESRGVFVYHDCL